MVGILTVKDDDEIMIITSEGMLVRCPVKDVRKVGRSTQGVRIMKCGAKDKVTSVARIGAKEEEE